MVRRFLYLIPIAVLLIACSSGKTAFRQGKFDLAVQRAAGRLQKRAGLTKRGHATAPLILQRAFVQAYEQHQNLIRRLSLPAGNEPANPFRWEAVYEQYGQLQTLTDNARRGLDRNCTTCTDWLSAYPASYADRQGETRELAAADRYEAAETAFAHRQENRLAARDAYLNYRKALEWVPNYRQATANADEALPFALLRVAVEPLSPSPALSASDMGELQRVLMSQFGHNDAPSPFVRLYPPGAIPDERFAVHQAVQMQVTEYVPYQESASSSATTVYSNQAYKVGEKKINDSTKVDILEKVKGTLTTHRREITAGLTLRMRAIDTQTGTVLWEEPIWESRNWATEWQTFSGDDRALNGQILKRADPFPPSRWSLHVSMRDELAGDVVHRLRKKYAKD